MCPRSSHRDGHFDSLQHSVSTDLNVLDCTGSDKISAYVTERMSVPMILFRWQREIQ